MKKYHAVWKRCTLLCMLICFVQVLFMPDTRAEGLTDLRLTRQVESMLSMDAPPQEECQILVDQCINMSHLYAKKSSTKSGFDRAIYWRIQSLALREKLDPPNQRDMVAGYQEVSRLYVNARNYKKAIEYKIKAVKIAEKIFLQNERTLLIHMYEEIAFYYQAATQYDLAIRWRKKAIHLAETLQNPGIEVESIYNNMIILYEHLKAYDQAIEWQHRAIARHRKNGGERLHYDYEQMARLYWESGNGDISEAQKWLLLAGDNAQRKNPPNDGESSQAYTKLSILHTKYGDSAQANKWKEAAREANRRAKDRSLILLSNRYPPETQGLNIKKSRVCEIFGFYDEAIFYIDQEVRSHPNDANLHLMIRSFNPLSISESL